MSGEFVREHILYEREQIRIPAARRPTTRMSGEFVGVRDSCPLKTVTNRCLVKNTKDHPRAYVVSSRVRDVSYSCPLCIYMYIYLYIYNIYIIYI